MLIKSGINCPHFFHTSCLEMFIEGRIKIKKMPMTCPSCAQKMDDLIIFGISSQELRDKYCDLATIYEMNKNPSTYIPCPTKGCSNRKEHIRG